MDHTAIKEINHQAVARSFNDQDNGALKMLPIDYKIEDILKINGERRYFRGALNTNSLSSFLAYVNDYAEVNKNAELFIDKDHMEAVAIFDLFDNNGIPRTAEHRALFEAVATPEYKAVNALLNSRHLDQRDLVEFAEEWGDVFTFIDTKGEVVDLKSAINSLRNMKINSKGSSESSVGEMSQTRSRTASIEASGKDVTIGGFTAEIRLYNELAPENITVKYRLHTGGDDIKVTARMLNYDRIMEAIAMDLASRIESEAEVKTFIGTFKS
jgi:uncharacterized protein YfdQ (DUF2303 family)